MRFFVAALLLSGVCSAQTVSGSLTGSVTDITGAVIPKTVATLRLERPPNTQYSTETDGNGEFQFDSLPAGVYGLRLDRTGFERLMITSVEVSRQTKLPPIALAVGCVGCCGREREPNFRFLPSASKLGTIVGEIRTERKAALAGAHATLYCENKSICGESKTNPKGRFEFANVPPGNHVVSAKLAGFYAGEVRVTARDGFESSNWQVTLEQCPDKTCDPARRPKHPIIICE